METVQRQLSEYLQCEMYHLLGAYGVAEEHLDRLSLRLQGETAGLESDQGAPNQAPLVLLDLVLLAQENNHSLGWNRYASDPRSRANPTLLHSADPDAWPVREPMPSGLPMTDIDRFIVGPKDESMATNRVSPWKSDEIWDRIPRFYGEAIAAIKAYRRVLGKEDDRYQPNSTLKANQINFARSLLAPRDGATEWTKPQAAREHLRRRLDRYEDRLRTSILNVGSDLPGNDEKKALERFRGKGTRTDEQKEFLKLILGAKQGDGEESLAVFVLRVQAEAHLVMHAVEAWRSMCIGEHADAIRGKESEWLERELERSIALSTFAYCVSRTAPWIFAKSEEERRSVIRDVAAAWENVVPIRCMWIASQISLLSLHRRAYAHALQGQPARAYNDYHKLQHLIRDTERRVGEAPLHVSGARGFLAGLNAEAHHHIGELYRAEHAHKPALEHFEAASHRLELLRREDETFNEVLRNSRWYIELQISRGKACYEMGRHKEALYWHLRAWRAFLELLSSETQTEPNTDHITQAIDWLESVKFEPELRKSEISERIGPVVEQLDRITAVGRVGALAAEILLRLGHLLFVLNVGYFDPLKADGGGGSEGSDADTIKRIRGTLALSCLVKAGECDPYSTLIGADLMKTRFRFNTWWGGDLPDSVKGTLATRPLKPIHQHWPRGGGDYERLTRIAEYLTLKARTHRFETRTENLGRAATDGVLARDLLLDLFMSTDSINVRKSQIHRFLMKQREPALIPSKRGAPAIEFVCMRRYSSPFPLLPRPSAFRALGGGYFVRLHESSGGGRDEDRAYGVVIDPGVDFVENLYRTGYSLGDIDMIVITHDHVDHLGALDPLLSLLHVRSQILAKQRGSASGDAAAPIAVLTSQSVHDRYDQVIKLTEWSENFAFHCYEKPGELGFPIEMPADLGFPEGYEIIAMSSAAGGERRLRKEEKDGHRDLSNQASHGLCIREKGGRGPSVAFTSDTPPPPRSTARARRREWEETWEPALSADVLVVHLGSVPLTELRLLDAGEQSERQASELSRDESKVLKLQEDLEAAEPRLHGQIEYAQWLRAHDPEDGREDATARIVGSVPPGWLPPPEHNFLGGVLLWAREYERRRWNGGQAPSDRRGRRTQGLFVVGELSEELGTMRGKVATRLNRRIFQTHHRRSEREADPAGPGGFPYALTADIGLHACVHPGDNGLSLVEVLCTTCNLDTDRTPKESYHSSHDVYEVCVKGENEGIFYNCLEHDPARQDEPAFLEQLERFDIFGR